MSFHRCVCLVLLLGVLFMACAFSAQSKSIAVFTFDNLTGSEAHAWIGTGFAEAMTEKLGMLDRVMVRDRREIADLVRVRAIKARLIKAGNAVEIGRLIGSDVLIFGAVQAAGSVTDMAAPLRATARLVLVNTGEISKAIQVDGTMGKLFELQSRMALLFAEMLNPEVSMVARNAIQQTGTDSLLAYKLYCEGLRLLDEERYEPAKEKFRLAQSKHPGILYAEAHHALGTAFLRSGKVREMLSEFKRDTARLSPIWFNLGVAYERAGKFEQSLEAFKTFVAYTDRRYAPWRFKKKAGHLLPNPDGAGTMFIMANEGKSVEAIEGLSGRLAWIKGAMKTEHPPTLQGDAVFLSMDNSVLCLNALTGEERWRLPCNAAVVSPVAVYGNEAFCILAGGELLAMDRASGSELWRRNAGGDSKGLLVRAKNFLCFQDGGTLKAFSAKDGRVVWQRALPGTSRRSFEAGNRLIVLREDGRLACLNSTTGKTEYEFAGLESACFWEADGQSGLVGIRQGTVFAVHFSGTELWQQRFEQPVQQVLTIGGTVVVHFNDCRVMFLEGATGKVRQTRTFQASVESLTKFDETLLVLLTNDDVLALSGQQDLDGPSDLKGYLHMAELLSRQGKRHEAIRVYEMILKRVHPGSQQACHSLAELYQKDGQLALANAWRQRARIQAMAR